MAAKYNQNTWPFQEHLISVGFSDFSVYISALTSQTSYIVCMLLCMYLLLTEHLKSAINILGSSKKSPIPLWVDLFPNIVCRSCFIALCLSAGALFGQN